MTCVSLCPSGPVIFIYLFIYFLHAFLYNSCMISAGLFLFPGSVPDHGHTHIKIISTFITVHIIRIIYCCYIDWHCLDNITLSKDYICKCNLFLMSVIRLSLVESFSALYSSGIAAKVQVPMKMTRNPVSLEDGLTA